MRCQVPTDAKDTVSKALSLLLLSLGSAVPLAKTALCLLREVMIHPSPLAQSFLDFVLVALAHTTHGGSRTVLRNLLSPATLWDLGIKARPKCRCLQVRSHFWT